jgi:hypothetical protein
LRFRNFCQNDSEELFVDYSLGLSKKGRCIMQGSIIGKDGAEMVIIPAGEFKMGSNDGRDNEKPVSKEVTKSV